MQGEEKTMSEIKLLPCPFCGGEAEFNENGTQIYCIECGLSLDVSECYEQGFSNARDTMIKKWNTRKPMERIIERLEIMADESNDSIGTELNHPQYYDGKEDGIREAIKVVKEEGGIE